MSPRDVVRADVDIHTTAWILNGMGVAFTVRDLLETEVAQPEVADELVVEQIIAWLEVDSPTG
ncbi:MAG: hypothetical protein M5U19_15355 [Microthrixaceae bacterium]|nr:hypothetical protein [Microthrixaceae bacterium]